MSFTTVISIGLFKRYKKKARRRKQWIAELWMNYRELLAIYSIELVRRAKLIYNYHLP